MHGFWVSYGLIRIKMSVNSPPVTVTHDIDLENKFTENLFLKINSEH